MVFQKDELDILISEFLCNQKEYGYTESKPEWYPSILDYINDNYDQQLTLDKLAQSVNLHPNYLARRFKHVHRVTIGEFIRGVRLKKAYMLLVTEKSSLSEITYQAGFYDQPHFSNTFYSTFKARPKKLRQSFMRLI